MQWLIERWDEKQAQRRLAAVRASPEISITVGPHQMLHEDRTVYELVRGYNELLQLYPEDPHQPRDLDAEVKRLRPRVAAGATDNAGASASASGADAAAAGGSGTRRDMSRSRSRSRGSSSSPGPPPPRAMRPFPRRAHVPRVTSSPEIHPSEEDDKPMEVDRPSRRLRRRESLENRWSANILRHGAASVTFVNEVNAEEIPNLVEGFRYVERNYVRAPDVPANDHLSDCLVSCECIEACIDPQECGCQDPSELVDDMGSKVFAYTHDRLFNFHLRPGTEVIECNASCSCDENCLNRVAQLPRDVPIEIFRTPECGWGARATVALPRGKVVGIYTGQLIRREEADRRYGERKSYIFDLDVRESVEDEDEDITERFSVDGYAYGNWTRFVNHSCEPNMRVYPVVWDTIPELNQPYLAFVATEDIPARTEMSIDYDPKAGEEARRTKQKGRQAVPEGARECRCGTESCRGWVRV
ncbi:hypothetical protein C2E23DRAFT_834846 [Lenzites betulinus]|nr:hypothetical protein C2E23DRAFT_834846 [Lenzites betulinus]